VVRESAVKAGLLPETAHVPLLELDNAAGSAPAAGALSRLPAPRRVPMC